MKKSKAMLKNIQLLNTQKKQLKIEEKNKKSQIFDNQIVHKLISPQYLANHLGISIKTIYDWVYKGKITYFRIGRLLRFKPADIESELNS